MAAWQFSVVLIPKLWVVKHQCDSSLLYSDTGYDTEVAWIENQPSPTFKQVLSTILPPAVSWHEDLLCWGNEIEHDIQVGCENNSIEGIHIRLDLNQNLNSIIVKLVKAAIELNCALFFPELKSIVDANGFALKNAVQKSKAAQFVNDSQGFLDNL
jgi:hypothetical protein